MQMTYEQTMRPGLMLAFANRRGSGYVMRSEKRTGPYGNGSNRRPPKRRAGFLYIFFTLLLSLILWPIGMLLLWRRKVRLQAGTKLLISLLTLCLSVFLIVFALTVPVDNPEFTAFQDRANDWLNQAEKDIASAADTTYQKSTETWNILSDFSQVGYEYAMLEAADAIDLGVEKAGVARAAVEGALRREPAEPAELPEATDAPDATEPEATDAPVPPADAETAEPTTEVEEADGIDLRLPEQAPELQDAQALSAGTLHADGSFTPDETTEPETWTLAEDVTPEPTEESTEAPTEAPAEEPEEQAIEAPVEEPAEEPVEAPAEAPTEEPVEASAEQPTEEPVEAPVEEPVEAPAEQPVEEPAEAPVERPVEEPVEAPAEQPVEQPAEASEGDGVMVPVEPTPEVTPEPPVATEAPAAFQVKSASAATVYYFENGSKGFHIAPNRHGMNNAPAHTLAEAFAAGKTPCRSCGMPQESILDEPNVAWVDENNLIHTTDECAAFAGDWRLIPLSEAIEAGYARCADCGADAYAEGLFPSPTATPEPELVTPSTPLKSAGEITVYYYDVSRSYHANASCVGMNNAPAHTLAEAAADGKHICGHCNPPSVELIGLPVLWLDEAGLCHTTDACSSFSGQYALIARDDALAQGLAACPDCGATEYLIPGTILAGQ